MTELHKQFIDAVKAGRGDKLKENPDLFSGLFWTGTQAQKLGLIDGTDDREVILKKDFVGTKEVDFSTSQMQSYYFVAKKISNQVPYIRNMNLKS